MAYVSLEQVSSAIGGKTFTSTPQFNVTLLRDTPPEAEMQWGDWRNTTYVGGNAPPFNADHALVRFCSRQALCT
jgi:hypothetical protein